MLTYAQEAADMSAGRSRQELEQDRMRQLALVRLIEVVGEAAMRIPDEEQAKHPEIEWRQITGTRNRLIHGYDNIDPAILWQIVSVEIPSLIGKLKKILGN